MPKLVLTPEQQTALNNSIFGVLTIIFSSSLELEETHAVVIIPSLAAALTPAVKDIMTNWAKTVEQLAKGNEWDSEVKATYLGECERQLVRLMVGMQSAKEFAQTPTGKNQIEERIKLLASMRLE